MGVQTEAAARVVRCTGRHDTEVSVDGCTGVTHRCGLPPRPAYLGRPDPAAQSAQPRPRRPDGRLSPVTAARPADLGRPAPLPAPRARLAARHWFRRQAQHAVRHLARHPVRHLARHPVQHRRDNRPDTWFRTQSDNRSDSPILASAVAHRGCVCALCYPICCVWANPTERSGQTAPLNTL